MAVAATNPYTVFLNGVDVDKEELRAILAQHNIRLGELPLTPAGVDVGMAVVYDNSGLGPSPASAGTRIIRFGGRPIGFFRPATVDIDGSVSITDALHVGFLLRKKTTAAAVLSLELHPDATVGVSDNFSCTLLRYQGAGDLQIVSGMTNQHAAAHTRVSEGGMATLYVDAVENAWFLKGETEV